MNRPGELPVPGVAIARLRRHAFAHPWPGNRPLGCDRHALDTTAITEPGRPTRVIVTFDVGYHASGWFKNSDYEQCLHISVSHPRFDAPALWQPGKPGAGIPAGPRLALDTPTDEEVRAWGLAFYGAADTPKAWFEPAAPVGDPYRMPNVVHLRLFYNRAMEPILPEGEVYQLKPWADGTSPAKVREGAGGDVR